MWTPTGGEQVRGSAFDTLPHANARRDSHLLHEVVHGPALSIPEREERRRGHAHRHERGGCLLVHARGDPPPPLLRLRLLVPSYPPDARPAVPFPPLLIILLLLVLQLVCPVCVHGGGK